MSFGNVDFHISDLSEKMVNDYLTNIYRNKFANSLVIALIFRSNYSPLFMDDADPSRPTKDILLSFPINTIQFIPTKIDKLLFKRICCWIFASANFFNLSFHT